MQKLNRRSLSLDANYFDNDDQYTCSRFYEIEFLNMYIKLSANLLYLNV